MLYFLAIVAPDKINEEVLVWKKYMEQEYGCKVALRSPAHITLIPPFNMAAEREIELGLHLAAFADAEKAFEIRLKNFDSFAPRVIFVNVIPDEALLQIKHRLDQYLQPLRNFPFKKEQRPFHPHITIANRDLRKSDYRMAWEYFSNLRYETGFKADSFALLKHNNKEWEIAARYLISK